MRARDLDPILFEFQRVGPRLLPRAGCGKRNGIACDAYIVVDQRNFASNGALIYATPSDLPRTIGEKTENIGVEPIGLCIAWVDMPIDKKDLFVLPRHRRHSDGSFRVWSRSKDYGLLCLHLPCFERFLNHLCLFARCEHKEHQYANTQYDSGRANRTLFHTAPPQCPCFPLFTIRHFLGY